MFSSRTIKPAPVRAHIPAPCTQPNGRGTPGSPIERLRKWHLDKRRRATPPQSFPRQYPSHLLHHVGDENSGSPERRLAMADRRIGDDVPSDDALGCLPLLTFRHSE
jgi:hypothetical protein